MDGGPNRQARPRPPGGGEATVPGVAVARFFQALSRLRGRRIAHPHGVAFAATLTPGREGAGAELLDRPGERPATVRLSRAIGLPEFLPDPCGVAIRFDDAYGAGRHQDLLLVTSGAARGLRHLLLPAWSFESARYSSLLPLRVGGRLRVVGAALVDEHGSGQRLLLSDLRRRERADLTISLRLAAPGGRWRTVGSLAVHERLSPETAERLRFDPANTGGGIELAGRVNRLRPPAYRGSQDGRASAAP